MDFNELEELWADILALDKHDSITNQMLAMELYETATGIQKNNTSVISLVTMSESVDYCKGSRLEQSINTIIKLKIHKHTGMSLNELLDMPAHEFAMVIRAVRSINRADSEALEKLEESLTD